MDRLEAIGPGPTASNNDFLPWNDPLPRTGSNLIEFCAERILLGIPALAGFTVMDFHRPSLRDRTDPQSGRVCEFCEKGDPLFGHRNALDQLVGTKADAVASAHLTEGGHIAHRLVELSMKPMRSGTLSETNPAALRVPQQVR